MRKDNEERFGSHFDDVVDVICAGSSPGVLAFAIACADLDRTVLLIDSPPLADLTDPDTVAYLRSMTDDLESVSPDLELTITRARPVPSATGGRPKIEPFFGGQLQNWSATCSTSPFGVVCTEVIDSPMTAWRTKSEFIRAVVLGTYPPDADGAPGLVEWLTEQALDRGVEWDSGSVLQRLIFEGGRVVGAVVDEGAGSRIVRAADGVALYPGPALAVDDWSVESDAGTGLQVALVGRTAARFGRAELLLVD